MCAILDLIKQYSDQELAFLYTYHIESYMEETQSQIRDYIRHVRGLSDLTIAQIVEDVAHSSSTLGCPRCHSLNWNIYDVQWEVPLSTRQESLIQSPIEQERDPNHFPQKTKIDCNICGYVIHDPNESFWTSLKKTVSFKK
ncbi:hypothetical protein LZQ00_18010 [Sphingobacterium sp. SRCM116780]|uniref:hypothetical protein n=1 Tax=Sphingobacterium sp. SRCM116780 TaxID=2907623 RepID=UPI001F304937|nr:hypothetical protein [Sphingobacterium sp. SRCM116780]UIR56142.1 hypothetical protein LZQ00_18010 [Sphingobacterium sp. SRCM116780]